ncbi:MAG: ABC transporter substrate-binding protein [Ethanoligenens sp.]
MKRIKVTATILGASVALSVLLSGCGKSGTNTSSGSKQLTTVRVGVMSDSVSEYVPIIGKNQKIFQKYGLDVQSTAFAAGINTVDAVTLNQMDFGMAADFAILNRFATTGKSDLRILAVTNVSDLNSDAGYKFYAKGLTSIKELAGKSIVVQKGTVGEYWIAKLLDKAGVSASSVKLLPVGSPQEGVAIVQSGQAVGMWASGKAAQALTPLSGIKSIADLKTLNAPTVSVEVSTNSYLTKNKTTAENFLKAYNDVYSFINKNPEKAAEILQNANNIPKEQALLNLKASQNIIQFKQQNIDLLDQINAWGQSQGLFKNKVDVRNFLNLDALKAVFPNQVSYK